MEDKTFDLVTELFSEMKNMDKRLSLQMKEMQIDLKKEIDKVSLKIENDLEPKIDSLFDGYKQTYEMCKENNQKIDIVIGELTKQEVEIKVLQGGKR